MLSNRLFIFERIFTCIFIYSIILCGCVRHKELLKKENVSNANKMRIISLSPSITEVLYQLGLEKHIIATANSKKINENIKNLGHYGPALDEKESEKRKEYCLKLNPTIIFAHDYLFKSKTSQSLSPILYNVNKKVSNVSELIDLIDVIATKTKITEKAKKLKEYIQWSLLETRLNLKGTPAKSYLILLNQDPIQVLGHNSFLSSAIELYALGNNVAPSSKTIVNLHRDDIRLLSPDVIIDLTENNYLRNSIRSFIPPDKIDVKKGKSEWLLPSANVVTWMKDIIQILHPNKM